MGRNVTLLLAAGIVLMAGSGFLAVAWRNRQAAPTPPGARLPANIPAKPKPQPAAPAAPFSTVRGPSIAEKINEAINKPADSEADIAIRITKSRWWRKPPTMSELAKFVDWATKHDRYTKVFINANFEYDAIVFHHSTPPSAVLYEGPLTGPRISIVLQSSSRPDRWAILDKLSTVLARAEYEGGPSR